MATVLSSYRSQSIGTTAVNVGSFTAPTAVTGVLISGFTLCNSSGAATSVSAYLANGGINTYIVNGASVLSGGALTLADEGNRIVLNSGDTVWVIASTASAIDATMSVAVVN